ncbi:hypothetical protein TIFTF001_004310 [Ficus carica]|uniref:Acyl-CoA dehydrogenase n=1 Tax=Ficus carica TaxID=3494 RepID=A0AA87ZB68_FICCA|nr:hypothetical protein TIFTF001_004310 [Ficus carica]
MQTPDQHPTAEDQSQPVARRIERLSLHLTPVPRPLLSGGQLRLQECARGAPRLSVDTASLSEFMRGRHRDIQERVFEYFSSRPELQTPIEISKDDHRQLCMRQLHGLVRDAGIRPFRYLFEDPAKYFAVLEAVGSVDMSLGIKTGVQFR